MTVVSICGMASHGLKSAIGLEVLSAPAFLSAVSDTTPIVACSRLPRRSDDNVQASRTSM